MMPPKETPLRRELALLYRFLAYLKMDDLTYTHLSCRLPQQAAFLIYPFGQLFEEVTPDSLLKVSFEGEVLTGQEAQYNQTGYAIHASIYKARPDVNAIVHLHTYAGVAVSTMACGLLPISQFSFHFYERTGYHAYDSLILNQDQQGCQLTKDLGQNIALFLKNHGTLVCGKTLQEALFYSVYLERACIVQTQAMAKGGELCMPPADTCRKARDEMRAFEPDLGRRDWEALMRVLQQKKLLDF